MMFFPSSFEKEVSLQSGPLPLKKGATYNSTGVKKTHLPICKAIYNL